MSWARGRRARCSATTLTTPSLRSEPAADQQRRRLTGDLAVPGPAALRHHHVDQAGLVLQVEERDPPRGRRPLAVGDDAADRTLDPGSGRRSSVDVTTPSASSSLAHEPSSGWPSGDTPVAHRSATASSTVVHPRQLGAAAPVTTAGQPAGPDLRRRARGPQRRAPVAARSMANAPAVASASSWRGVSDGTRRARSSICTARTAGRPRSRSARSAPMPRTEPMPEPHRHPVPRLSRTARASPSAARR